MERSTGGKEAVHRKGGDKEAGHGRPEEASTRNRWEGELPETGIPQDKRAGSKRGQRQESIRARKRELPAVRTPQSKRESNRDRREKEHLAAGNPKNGPQQRPPGVRTASGGDLQGQGREEQGPQGERAPSN